MRAIVAALSVLYLLGAVESAGAAVVLTLRPDETQEEVIFGYALATAGGDVVVGAPHTSVEGHARAGAAYLFEGRSGSLRLSLRDPEQGNDDVFGLAVAGSRERILVGAPRTQVGGLPMAGAAYLFDARSGNLLRTFHEPTPTANAEFGAALALVDEEALIAAPATVVGGVPGAGRVYRFDASDKVSQTLAAWPSPRAYDIFGSALVPIGGDLLVGAPQTTIDDRAHAGAAYLLERAIGAPRRRYGNPVPATDDLFGWAVASTPTLVAIGAPNARDGAFTRSGAVYLYDRASGNLVRTLREPVADRNDRWFGYALASACGHLLVSTLHATVDGKWLAGLVYEIEPASGNVIRTLREPAPSERAGFGIAVAALNHRPLIGAERGGGAKRGAAYLFDCAAADTP